MSEWRHRDGIRYAGSFVTRFNAPRQSETTSTLPERSLCCLLMLSRIRCIASRPRSSPLYAFATDSASEIDPTIRPRPLEHSMTNAAEHRFGYISRIYDPSVTATSEPSAMDSFIHDSPPDTCRCSHSQVFPHKRSISRKDVGSWGMSRKDVGAWYGLASGSDDVRRQHSPPRVGSTEQIVLRWLAGWQCKW